MFFRYSRNFKRVNMAEHGRGADEFNDILDYDGENSFITSGNGFSLKCILYTFKKHFPKDYVDFIKSYQRRTNVMTRCRIQQFCKR